jgi:hypothetical protein
LEGGTTEGKGKKRRKGKGQVARDRTYLDWCFQRYTDKSEDLNISSNTTDTEQKTERRKKKEGGRI